MRALLYLAFFLSGAAALAYESVWTRYLGLLVGHDAYAQVVVLVIFLGGMSGGAAWVAGRTRDVRRPLMWYAAIEGIVGVLALLFHDLFLGVSSFAYDTLFPALAGTPFVGPVKWILAALLILPQSVLLGTTFPLMSAGVIRLFPDRPGQVLSWLYFTNSLGGAAGVLLAGFVLVEMAGLPGTLAAAGAMNLVVALATFVAGRVAGEGQRATGDEQHDSRRPPGGGLRNAGEQQPAMPQRSTLLLAVAFGTAVASFIYEIDWIRMLSLVLGSATHSFELMLSAFILGLAIGALLVQRNDRLTNPMATLGWIQVAMGVAAVLTLPIYLKSFDWMATLLATFTRTDAGYAGFSVVRYGVCLLVMLPATICAGMTLPLITRSLMDAGEGERAIGRVYAWNTLGSIVGVALAALVLMPLIGLKPMLILAGALDIALGLVIFTALGSTRRAAAAGIAAAAVVGAVALLAPMEQRVVTSGVFRRGLVSREGFTLPYYADGRTATVSVGETTTGSRWIATNGKPDASLGEWWLEACTDGTTPRRLGGDEITQVLLPIVAHAYHPEAKRAAMIGFGSGMSSHILLGVPTIEELATIEIEPEMVRASRIFQPANARVYDDPRSRIVMRDAKAHFAGTASRWDLIVSEPSNPWVSGVSGLFTVEFYRRVVAALEPDGVFGQWLHTYELSDRLVLTVLAAINEVFPDWQVHQVGAGDLLVVATPAASLPPMRPEATLAAPGLAQDLCRFAPLTGDELRATRLAGPALLGAVVEGIGQPNSDFYPALDLGAERSRYTQSAAAGVMSLGYDWYNLANALLDRRGVTNVAGGLALQDVALLRESWSRTRLDSVEITDPLLQQARRLDNLWTAQSASPVPPADWKGWLDAHLAAMRVRHAGMAGIIDTAFFDAGEAAAVRLGALAEVRVVLDFRRAVQGWDAFTALESADVLQTIGAVPRLLSADELRDGAVVMALRAGDVQRARDWLVNRVDGATRPHDDLRTLLLTGWVAEGLAREEGSPR